MIKDILYGIVVLFIFNSCINSETAQDNRKSQDTLANELQLSPIENIDFKNCFDSVINNTNRFYWITIPTEEFFKQGTYSNKDLPLEVECEKGELFCPELKERKRLNDSTIAKRVGMDLYLKMKNGEFMRLSNKECDEGDDCESYYYLHYIQDLGLHVVEVNYSEGKDVLLINSYNGTRISISGYPIVSPDRKRIIGTSSDLIAGFDFNGIKLYEIALDHSLKLILDHASTWGPKDAKWISNNVLVMKKEYIGNMETMSIDSSYCKMIIN